MLDFLDHNVLTSGTSTFLINTTLVQFIHHTQSIKSSYFSKFIVYLSDLLYTYLVLSLVVHKKPTLYLTFFAWVYEHILGGRNFFLNIIIWGAKGIIVESYWLIHQLTFNFDDKYVMFDGSLRPISLGGKVI